MFNYSKIKTAKSIKVIQSIFLKGLVLNLQSQFMLPIETASVPLVNFRDLPKHSLRKCGEVITIDCTSIQQSALFLDFV